ncbi:MAG TPA: hypothetical protein VHI13_12725 [Candidatus Kapabacteria bacterium]|nr:hypothetical protein [Candidatus Kapabacteria bacterium]
MQNDEQDRIVQDYLRQSMEILRNRGERTGLDTLESIAREAGMGDDEIARIKAAAHEHFERGSGFLRHHQWDDAIKELTMARALNPVDVPTLSGLAQAHAGRWREKKSHTDSQQAEELARRCIEFDPDHEASFQLLEELHPSHGAPAPPTTPADLGAYATNVRARVRRTIAFSVLGTILVSFIALGIIGSQMKKSKPDIPVPITLVSNPAMPGMQLHLDRAVLMDSDNVFCVRGDVSPPLDSGGRATRPTSINLRLDLFDRGGVCLVADTFAVTPCKVHTGFYFVHRDEPYNKRIASARLTPL